MRKLVDQHVRGHAMMADDPKDALISKKADVPKDAIMAIVGLGASGRTDISERHDEALAEFLRSDPGLDQERDSSDGSS